MKQSLFSGNLCALALAGSLLGNLHAQIPESSNEKTANQGGIHLPIRAKTHEEYVAYQAAVSNLANPDVMAKAADDFAAKFPESNLRVLLYRKLMKAFHTAGDRQKTLEAGLKVLSLDSSDPEALIEVASIQEEQTTAMDLDRDQRMDQALANAQKALTTIDTDLTIPSGSTPDRVETYKKYLRSMALAIIGAVQYKRQQYPDAEVTLRRSIEADPENPDGVVLLRLALTLDQQKRYDDALQQANRAVNLTKEDTDAGKVAREEQLRLMALLQRDKAAENPSPDKGAGVQSPTAPSH